MITSERQYRITKAQLDRLYRAIETFDIKETTTRTGSGVLAQAHLDALNSEASILHDQLREYDDFRVGKK